MHRIEMAVDMVFETLRRHGKDVDCLESRLRAEAEALVQSLRDQGLPPDEAIHRAHDLLPHQVLPRYDIHPIREGLWLRVCFVTTLVLLAALDVLWLGRGQSLIFTLVMVILVVLAGVEFYAWWEPRFEDNIQDGTIRHHSRRIKLDDIEKISRSRWGVVRLELTDGSTIKLSSISLENIYFWKRLYGELREKVVWEPGIVSRIEHLTSPGRDLRIRSAVRTFNLMVVALLVVAMAIHFVYDIYFPLLLTLGTLISLFVNLRILGRVQDRFKPLVLHRRYIVALAPIVMGFEIMMVFHDQIYFISLLALTAAVFLALLIRELAPPCLAGKYFPAAGAIISFTLLAPLAAGFITPQNVKTIGLIDGTAVNFLELNVQDRNIFSITLLFKNYAMTKSSLADLEHGEVKPLNLAMGPIEKYRQPDCFLASDEQSIICMIWDLFGDNRTYFASTDDFDFSEFTTEMAPGLELDYDLGPSGWSPDGRRVILIKRTANPRNCPGSPAFNKYYLFHLGSGQVDYLGEQPDEEFVAWYDNENLVFVQSQIDGCTTEPTQLYMKHQLTNGEQTTIFQLDSNEILKKYFNAESMLMLIETKDHRLVGLDLAAAKQYPLSFTLSDVTTKRPTCFGQKPNGYLWLASTDRDRKQTDLARIDFERDTFDKYQIATDGKIYFYSISPDSEKMIYILGESFDYLEPFVGGYLYEQNLQTGAVTRLADLNTLDFISGRTDWSRDGQSIYVATPLIPSLLPPHWKMKLMKVRLNQ